MARKNWVLDPSLQGGFTNGTANGLAYARSGIPAQAVYAPSDDTDDFFSGNGHSQRVAYKTIGTETYVYLDGLLTAAGSFASGDFAAGAIAVKLNAELPAGLNQYDTFRMYITCMLADGTTVISNSTESRNSFHVYQVDEWVWLTVKKAVACPATTNRIRLRIGLNGLAGAIPGAVLDFSYGPFLVEKSVSAAEPGVYFDGDHGGSWDGTAHASTSQQIAAAISNIEGTPARPGESLNVIGTGFGIDGDALIDDVDLTPSGWTETSFHVTVPADAINGQHELDIVPGIGGGSAPTTATFDVGGGSVSAVTPAGSLWSGVPFVIDGSGLGSGGSVTINNKPCPVPANGWSPDGTKISAFVPLLDPGTYNLVVTPQGASALANFSVTLLPVPLEVVNGGRLVQKPMIYTKKAGVYVSATSVYYKLLDHWYQYAINTVTPPPPPPDDNWPTGGKTITVNPAGTLGRTVAAIQAAIDGAGVWDIVKVPGGAPWTGDARLYLKDYVCLMGDGIYAQAAASPTGTWIKAALTWGSEARLEKLLIGFNNSTKACGHQPYARSSTSWPGFSHTKSVGCTHFVTQTVRFKGGADGQGHLMDMNNFGSGRWDQTWYGTRDMISHRFYDTEWERPMTITNGMVMNLWWDCRAGGSKMEGNKWIRNHFGVKNGYRSGIDGYGLGVGTLLMQPCPAEHADDGPRPAYNLKDTTTHNPNCIEPPGETGSTNCWYPGFDWDQVDHGATDNYMEDCLFEYVIGSLAAWDICDYARSYSVWMGNQTALPATNTVALNAAANLATGWGNPPQQLWTRIPIEMWNVSCNRTRCYHKGTYGNTKGIVSEIGKSTITKDCFCGTGNVAGNTQSYGNQILYTSGTGYAFTHPTSPIFNVDWSGTAQSGPNGAPVYTPSPFDPA